MSLVHLERAVHRLAVAATLTPGREPAEALAAMLELSESPAASSLAWVDLELDLDAAERGLIEDGDVVEMYRRGVHPLIVRLFAAGFGIDYVSRYEDAGLR